MAEKSVIALISQAEERPFKTPQLPALRAVVSEPAQQKRRFFHLLYFGCYTLAVVKSCVSMQKFCMLNLGINTRLGDDIIASCRQRTASFLLAVYPL